MAVTIHPSADNDGSSIGHASYRFTKAYIAGSLDNGAKAVTVAQAYDHINAAAPHSGHVDTADLLDTSAGVTDAGKPIKLDANGNVDATMINEADIDHGGIGGLLDDDHTQYTKKATLTTQGDIYYASAANTPARLAIGTARNLMLSPSGGVPVWSTFTAALAHNLYFSKDYATLQDALTAANSAGGGIVMAAPGTHAGVTVGDNTRLIGYGESTIIDGTTASNGVYITGTNSSVENLTAKCTSGGSYRAVRLANGVNVRVEGVHITDSANEAIYATGAIAGLWIKDCVIDDCDVVGIAVLSSNTWITISGNTIKAVGGLNAIQVRGDYGAIYGNKCAAGSSDSILLHADSSEIVVTGNYCAGAITDSGTNNVVGDNS